MQTVIWDIETFSQINLKECGVYIYAAHASTGAHFICFVVDDGEVQVWRPGDPPPEPFVNPTEYKFVSDNWTFENAILQHKLIPDHGFIPIPIENQDCAQRLALANAYPAELGLRCEALGLPYRKDPEARRAMLRLSRPQTAKKRKKPEDPAARERDLALLLERCKSDVQATRAAYHSPRLRPLLREERSQLLLDMKINERGICANVPFLEAVRDLAVKERNAVNVRLNELSVGVITSVDQVKRIKDAINARGHQMTTLGKRSVSATLAHESDAFVRELLLLRQRGAYASVRAAKRLLAHADPVDGRIRGWGRIFGGGPGRWSSPGPQLHNLKRNDADYPASLVDALLAGDHKELARWGNPLAVAAELSRAALCAKPGHVLMCADFGAIESRVLAWLAGETWKLDVYRQYDVTGDKSHEPYRVIAAQMLRKNTTDLVNAERQLGKCADLAAGFGGSVGAWRRIAHDEDIRDDAEVRALIQQWRNTHPAIREFWKELARAVRVAIRTGQPILVAPAPRPPIVAAFDGYALTLTLPSGRTIVYPGAHLTPNTKFEDADPDVEFFDNARGQWKPTRGWFGTLVENVVQGTARDLLAAALLRFEARGLPVVFHCHDEIVIEMPEISEQEVLAILIEPPAWAMGLPLGGKVHSAPIYLDAPATGEPPTAREEIIDLMVNHALDTFIAGAEPLPATKEIERGAEEDFLASLDETLAPLTDLVTLPMDASGHVTCPFHDDPQPSCKIYSDHWHCFGCGEHGGRMDWLTRVEGMTKAEAIAALQDWSGAVSTEQQQDNAARTALAKEIWLAAQPLAGTIGERYLVDTRGIDVGKLPPTIHNALRFHPRCVFGARTVHPCIIALMRDPVTAVPVGIHRSVKNGAVVKLDRMALGRMGVVMFWPLIGDCGQLVIGEGIETTLAAATRISYAAAALTPAWSAIAKGGLSSLPVLPDVSRLILLVDNDENGEGQKAAAHCRQIWTAAGRTVAALVPKHAGWDFNDEVLGRKA